MSGLCVTVSVPLIVDDPRPPGPVELDQNIPGTVTLSWAPSPDEKRDDRLHYMVSQRDSFKCTWRTVADNLFNNKFTVVNILPGWEYYFRVFAKNDMGPSTPSEPPVFETRKEKGLFHHFNQRDAKSCFLCLHPYSSYVFMYIDIDKNRSNTGQIF